MARQRKRASVSKVETKKKTTGVKSPSIEVYDIPLKLMMSVRYIIYGKVTGRKYIFEQAGSVVPIDSRDAEDLLARKSSRACCGSRNGSKNIFEIVE